MPKREYPPITRKLTSTSVQEAVLLYADGWSIRELANKYGSAYTTMHYHLQKAGVIFRPKGGRKASDAAN